MTEDAGSGFSAADQAGQRRRQVRVGAVVALALAVGFVLWLVLRGGDSSPSASTTAPTGTQSVPISAKGLRSLAAVGIPIYWAGARPGTTYELTKTADNRVLVRYLPAGTRIGTKTPFLTIGTYPLKNAFSATTRLAQGSGSVAIPVGHGGVAFYSRARSANVYLAYPGLASQIEVYDPLPGAAHQAVFSGQVVPVAGGAWAKPAVPKAVTPTALKTLAASLGHPLYWAGPMPGSTYELTRPWNGSVFVRYLPRGVPVGTKHPYLTVATYPVLGALAALRRTAASASAHTFDLPGGGLAVADDRDPKSIHLAFPNSDYQVEVFDPSPAAARSVASHRIAPVR
jgi:hypothetical protein